MKEGKIVAFENFRPFRIKVAGISIDPSRLSKFPPNFMKNLGTKVANILRNHIRTSRDVFNKPFPKYTKEYAKRKSEGRVNTNGRGPQHYTSPKPNLSLIASYKIREFKL